MLAAALLTLMTTAHAEGTPIISGELEGTGHTLRAKDNQIYLGTYYARGVTPDLELGTSVLGWLFGANLSAEYAFIQSKEQALSGSLSLGYDWDGGYNISLTPTYTLGGQKTNRLNVSLGYGLYSDMFTDTEGVEYRSNSSTIPLTVSYDIASGLERSVFRFGATSNILGVIDGSPVFNVYGKWHYGWETYRLSLGLLLTNSGISDLEQALEVAGVDWSPPPLIPIPTVSMWWRF
jgi:hypothetical protein